MTDRDPLELRVLGTLRTGVESPSTVSSRLGVAREDVATALERAVVDGLATRLDLGRDAAVLVDNGGARPRRRGRARDARRRGRGQ